MKRAAILISNLWPILFILLVCVGFYSRDFNLFWFLLGACISLTGFSLVLIWKKHELGPFVSLTLLTLFTLAKMLDWGYYFLEDFADGIGVVPAVLALIWQIKNRQLLSATVVSKLWEGKGSDD